MDWAQRMIFDAVGPSNFASSHESVLNDDQHLWDGCNQSQLGVVAELVDIKADGHISEEYMIEYLNGLIEYCPPITLCREITTKNDVNLEYCKFYGDARWFVPHGQYGRTYSYWPIIITPYNLSPVVACGFENIRPSTDRTFMIQEILMWTVNDLPAYGIASEWSTAGVMGCLVCMDDTRAFHLQHGRKACYFDTHKQFLPAHHPHRRNKKAFMKNHIENKVARLRLTGDQILDRVENISPTVEMPLSLPDGYGSDHKWTK
ncbi:hypothetical protein Sango_1604100 [Sesamum angolense]|uniref:Uncharacterized protein n=1 Tax=Sesamum angolense TaxID=2727404 RepID=A0AAE1WJX6_9LAMI|nr:hypothetical protein Sango_1604100 [Sesamum angolense]